MTDLDVLERRLREFNLFGVVPKVVQEAADALALLRQERKEVQGLIETWRTEAVEEMHKADKGEGSFHLPMLLSHCADQLEHALSGACVSPEAQDTK